MQSHCDIAARLTFRRSEALFRERLRDGALIFAFVSWKWFYVAVCVPVSITSERAKQVYDFSWNCALRPASTHVLLKQIALSLE